MSPSEISYDEPVPVQGYGPGFFRIAEQVINGAVLVLPDRTVTWGGFAETEAIIQAAAQFDILFVGTGADIAHLPDDFRVALETAGIGVEPMASPSACRLYNILVSEGRRVACALLPL